MNHTCTETKSSSWMEMEGGKSRSLQLSCPTTLTKIFANPGAGSTSATHAQTLWRGQGQLYRGMHLNQKIPGHI